jgi:hypothetical protein
MQGTNAGGAVPYGLMAFDTICGGVGTRTNGTICMLPPPPAVTVAPPAERQVLMSARTSSADARYATAPTRGGSGGGQAREDYSVGPNLHVFDKDNRDMEQRYVRQVAQSAEEDIYSTVAHSPPYPRQHSLPAANLYVSAPSGPVQYSQKPQRRAHEPGRQAARQRSVTMTYTSNFYNTPWDTEAVFSEEHSKTVTQYSCGHRDNGDKRDNGVDATPAPQGVLENGLLGGQGARDSMMIQNGEASQSTVVREGERESKRESVCMCVYVCVFPASLSLSLSYFTQMLQSHKRCRFAHKHVCMTTTATTHHYYYYFT